jgi:hypothetical protein
VREEPGKMHAEKIEISGVFELDARPLDISVDIPVEHVIPFNGDYTERIADSISLHLSSVVKRIDDMVSMIEEVLGERVSYSVRSVKLKSTDPLVRSGLGIVRAIVNGSKNRYKIDVIYDYDPVHVHFKYYMLIADYDVRGVKEVTERLLILLASLCNIRLKRVIDTIHLALIGGLNKIRVKAAFTDENLYMMGRIALHMTRLIDIVQFIMAPFRPRTSYTTSNYKHFMNDSKACREIIAKFAFGEIHAGHLLGAISGVPCK